MALFLGIDGGGTHTRAWLGDETGRVLGTGAGGTANFHHAGWDGAAQAVLGAAAAARAGREAELCAGVFLGLAAVASAEARERWTQIVVAAGLVPAARHVGVDHDIRIALAGGLAGRPGLALIAGTGSACYGRSTSGATWQAGGWGSILDDAGGGYWLAVQAIVAAIRAEDGRGPATVLREAVLRALGLANLREAVTKLHAGQLPRHELAQFGPQVVAAAEAGDAAARSIVERGAAELALMAGTVARKLFPGGHGEAVLCGSVARLPAYSAAIAGAFEEACATVEIVEPVLPPAGGAVLLALELAGIEADAALVERLRATPG